MLEKWRGKKEKNILSLCRKSEQALGKTRESGRGV